MFTESTETIPKETRDIVILAVVIPVVWLALVVSLILAIKLKSTVKISVASSTVTSGGQSRSGTYELKNVSNI